MDNIHLNSSIHNWSDGTRPLFVRMTGRRLAQKAERLFRHYERTGDENAALEALELLDASSSKSVR